MALITCPDCRKSVSDRATACPNCGAPVSQAGSASQATSAGLGASPGPAGEVCPFSGHTVPAGAFVCECGAYYGYKGGVLTDSKFKLLLQLIGISVALFVLGYVFEWKFGAIAGVAGTVILGVVFLVFVLPVRVQGKKWWRAM